MTAQPHPQIKVGQLKKPHMCQQIIFAGYFLSDHHAWVTQAIPVEEEIMKPLKARAVLLVKSAEIRVALFGLINFTFLVHEADAREARRNTGMRLHILDLLLKLVRLPCVVRMMKRIIFSFQLIYKILPIRIIHILLMANLFYPAVIIGAYNIPRAVGRAVIYNVKLKIGKCLVKNTVNALAQIFLMII